MISGLKTCLGIVLLVVAFFGCGKTPAVVPVNPEPKEEVPAIEPDPLYVLQERRIDDIRPGLPVPEILPGPAPAKDTESAPEEKPVIHQVKWNRETFFSIALWYTGSGSHWRQLVKANPNIEPRRLRIGDTIRIPENLLKTRKPMPEEFLKPVQKLPVAGQPKPAKSSAKKKAPLLFGPVEGDPGPDVKETNELPVPLETID